MDNSRIVDKSNFSITFSSMSHRSHVYWICINALKMNLGPFIVV